MVAEEVAAAVVEQQHQLGVMRSNRGRQDEPAKQIPISFPTLSIIALSSA